jgi:hypothetical protein
MYLVFATSKSVYERQYGSTKSTSGPVYIHILAWESPWASRSPSSTS